MTNAAHPLRADIRGSEMSSIKDPNGKSIFPNPKGIWRSSKETFRDFGGVFLGEAR
jgi:hypothetical protein